MLWILLLLIASCALIAIWLSTKQRPAPAKPSVESLLTTFGSALKSGEPAVRIFLPDTITYKGEPMRPEAALDILHAQARNASFTLQTEEAAPEGHWYTFQKS